MTETKKSSNWSWEERREIVRAFHASGQTQRAFCRHGGLTANTLRNWCRRLGDEAGGGGETAANAGSAPPWLLELHLRADAPTSKGAGISLVTRAGVRIEVHLGFDAATLQRLLALVGDTA